MPVKLTAQRVLDLPLLDKSSCRREAGDWLLRCLSLGCLTDVAPLSSSLRQIEPQLVEWNPRIASEQEQFEQG